MQEYETITMPEEGLGSFLTSNLDEIDDNVLMFGNAGGINSMKEVADRMAKMGREGDTFVVHASEKEVMVPREVAENNPQLVAQIKDAIAAEGADPEAYIVGSDRNSINPMTGQREFFLKKLVGKIKKVFKKAAKIILPVAALVFTGGAGIPFLGAAGTAAVASGVGSLIQGESFKDALKSAAIAGIGTGLVGGLTGGFKAIASGSGTFGSGFAQGAIGTLPGGLQTGAKNLFGIGQAAPEITQLSQLNPEQLEYATRLDALKPGLGEKALVDSALNAVPGTAAAAGTSSVLGTAVKYGLPTLLAAGSLGAFDEIPAEEIDLTDMNVDLTDTAEDRLETDPEKYSTGTPSGPSNYITPTQAIYSGQPITSASYSPSLGTYNPIVPSLTYANLIPTGAGTNNMMGTMVPSSGGVSTYVPPAPIELPNFQQPIYGYDEQGNPIYTPTYNAPITPSVQQETAFAANGGAMNFPRRTGQIEGPGTETSDDIPAMLSDGEFVMTAKAVKGAGNGSREQGFRKMYDIMRSFEGGAVA